MTNRTAPAAFAVTYPDGSVLQVARGEMPDHLLADLVAVYLQPTAAFAECRMAEVPARLPSFAWLLENSYELV